MLQFPQDANGYPIMSATDIVLSDASATANVNVEAGLDLSASTPTALTAPSGSVSLRVRCDVDFLVGKLISMTDAFPVSNGWFMLPCREGVIYYLKGDGSAGKLWFFFEIATAE